MSGQKIIEGLQDVLDGNVHCFMIQRFPRVLNKHRDDVSGALYCGRGSVAGNPFKIGRDGTRDEVCDKYEDWAPKQPWWEPFLETARGRDLICFCVPKRCHCNFILREANR